ncbi:ATP-binding protein [Photobacterium phosphoreum]|uniref:ATP-binding protein n=1 Tax=Photobacterium phosphoreum TaxID=659 RepID=UPI000D169ECA|nr:ATP-binding protein [Photobacterium phosphoreum]PSU66047.1 hypothetical protein CTM75_03015 [Photobacterium phosphoreum]
MTIFMNLPNYTNQTLIVRKNGSKQNDEDKGWLKPLFVIANDQTISVLEPDIYPNGIYISKAYQEIEKNFNNGELFILERHMFDEERSQAFSTPHYFSLVHHTKSLNPNMMLPVIETSLPNREDGLFPQGVVLPTKDAFFVKDGSKVYGPLTAQLEDGQYRALPKKTQALRGLANDDLAIYDYSVITDFLLMFNDDNGRQIIFLPSIKTISTLPFEKLDYISDDRLVAYFNSMDIGRNSRFLAKREAQKLQDGLKHQQKIKIMPSDRLSRLESILKEYLGDSDVGKDIIRTYLKTDEGKDFLSNYVAKHQSSLIGEELDKIKSQIGEQRSELEKSLSQLEEKIASKRSEYHTIYDEVKEATVEATEQIKQRKQLLEQDLAALEAQSEEEKQNILAEQQRDKQEKIDALSDKISSLGQTITSKNTELVEIEQRMNEAGTIIDLQGEKEYLKRDIDQLKRAVESHSRTLGDPEKLAESMAQVKLVNDILNGRKLTPTPTIICNPAPKLDDKQPTSAMDLVEQIAASFEQDPGKTFNNDELVNILICFTQSFLSILSGPPGVGKTTTVIRLADAMNLGDLNGQQNFIYVPVGRGWVSSRDTLGFFNSLRDCYQPSRTGLYEFLRRNEEEEYQKSPRLILLDEANLSSIEHYWSDFLGLSDMEARSRAIDTGHPNREEGLLRIGGNVRFMATINNDATTERLSPRLLNRVPVITLDADSSLNSTSSLQFNKLQGALDYELLEKFFLPNERDEMSVSDKLTLDDIVKILSEASPELGLPIIISPRKRIAIQNYCMVASQHMENEEAIDFAIAQHILPSIEGFGVPFRTRLERLRGRLGNQLPRSKRILDRIISSGSDFTNSYSFF